MYQNPTTHSIRHDAFATAAATADYWREKAVCLPQPAAESEPYPGPDPDTPDAPEQGHLPTGPSHVVARGTPKRTAAQLDSARTFLGAAGKVAFSQGQATLKAIWMTFAYYASLGDGRVCFASIETLAKRALVSPATVRRHVGVLVALGRIHTDHRKGGHAPTTWTVYPFASLLSPNEGNQNDWAAQSPRLGSASTTTDEVRDVRSAPTEQNGQLASKQPDGACAPPAAQKKPPQKTKKEQPTQTAEPTQTLAPAKTDGGGETRGASEKQIKFLRLLADRAQADPAEDLWRAADPKRLQAQIKAAVPFKDLKVKHTHGVDVEAVTVVFDDEDDGGGDTKSCIQRCLCGAARSVMISKGGLSDLGLSDVHEGWKLVGHIVNYDTANAGLAVTVSDDEQADHDTGDDRIVDLTDRWRARQMPMSYVAALVQSLPEDGKGWNDSTVPVDRLDG